MRLSELLGLFLLIIGYFVLMKYVLPRFGVPT
jgi:hypothetical protein